MCWWRWRVPPPRPANSTIARITIIAALPQRRQHGPRARDIQASAGADAHSRPSARTAASAQLRTFVRDAFRLKSDPACLRPRTFRRNDPYRLPFGGVAASAGLLYTRPAAVIVAAIWASIIAGAGPTHFIAPPYRHNAEQLIVVFGGGIHGVVGAGEHGAAWWIPNMAAVLPATAGLAGLLHMPNGLILRYARVSVGFANVGRPAITFPPSGTMPSLEGVVPIEQNRIAPSVRGISPGIFRLPS
jgi:hypothetical protein